MPGSDNNDPKTLLIICGGIEALHGVRHAKGMGFRVIVSDQDPQAPAMGEADAVIVASTYDTMATADAAQAFAETVGPIHGVIALGSDVPMTVAAVATRLGLTSLSEQTAALAADKLAMKQQFARDGVPIPWFAPVESAGELARLIELRDETLIIKPVDSRGSRGVARLLPDLNPQWAFDQAMEHSPTGRVMVEAYLPGHQVSTESLVINGACTTPGLSDRNYEFLERFAPFFVENGGDLPATLSDSEQASVFDVISKAAKSLDLSNGSIKGDVVMHNGTAHIIEVATRLSGGFFCSLEIPLNTGVDFLGCVMRHAVGLPIDPAELEPSQDVAVCQRYLWAEPGEVISIDGYDQARVLPGVEDVVITTALGEIIAEPTNCTPRAAMVITTGASRAEAQANAARAIETIRIKTVPLASPFQAKG